MGRRVEPAIASIPPGAPFLPTLVNALLSGDLVDGYAPGNDPLALSVATIWVPTRRAARELATEFVRRLDGQTALLPTIRALGDVDDEGLFFEQTDALEVDLQASISGMQRQLTLAKLIAGWAGALKDRQRYHGDGALMIPATMADACWFAQDLARLMDMVTTEEVSWDRLSSLVPADHADWWQLTLQFLEIATATWPAYLAELGVADATSVRTDHLNRQAAIYSKEGSSGPVIAAGSTGSIPATARLLEAIAFMENGIVVLPGVDRDMSDEMWEKIDLPDNDRNDSGTAPGHPQYGLRKLLREIGIGRGDVHHIGGVDSTGSGTARVRETLVSLALLPSSATGKWRDISLSAEQKRRALEGIQLIEAPGEREESLAISLALRETLEDRGKTAALITPDRNLARRVAVELRRFGLPVDDSAGQPLRNRPQGTFARLVLQVACRNMDPIALASLLKHPLACFGGDPFRARRAGRLLELAVLRGAIVPVKAGEFAATANDAQSRADGAEAGSGNIRRRTPLSVRDMSDEDWLDIHWLAARLDAIFAPLDAAQTTLAKLAAATITWCEACGLQQDKRLDCLYGKEDGQALQGLLSEMVDHCDDAATSQDEWPDIFDALLGERAVRPVAGTHPRLSILGPLEARLQTFDRIVLGGLNEKSWPATARNDPFLSRPMKSVLGLPPPERRTGLAAHDFQTLLGMGDVVISRSIRADNAKTIPSRWLQRLLKVAGKEAGEEMRERGTKYTQWGAQIDHPSNVKSLSQPAPCPPVAARPTSMSITEIETWIKDPYAIYAKHILKLVPLEPLWREADARERGSLYHQIFEDLVREHSDLRGEDAVTKCLQLADHWFAASEVPQEVRAIWRPRFDTIAEEFVRWNDIYLADVERSLVELSAVQMIGDFRLSGRADRIDVLKDGTLSIIDYKTGSSPSVSDVKKLLAPQLPLEAALASKGSFGALDACETTKLIYPRLRPSQPLPVDEIDAGDLGEKAWQQLEALIDAYRQVGKPYISKARVVSDRDREGDYDHLARVREWSFVDEGGQ